MTEDGGLRTEDKGRVTKDRGRGTTYDLVLFAILMVLLFVPLLQQHLLCIPLKPLNGVTLETEKPDFDFESYRSGNYAKQQEAYLSEHFGFREPVIRLYNQYLWSCYRKTYAHDVVAGKKGWLYYPESVRDYYGTELLRWHPSVEEAQRSFDLDAKHLSWVRTILKENGVELMAFMAPEKGTLYSEYLPDRERDTITFNAREYFERQFIERDFPCIEMTRWFQQMKDTVSYPLIPQTGAHWLFPAVYATDSLLRYMEALSGQKLAKLSIGELHERDSHGADNDLEQLLNLSLPIWHRFGFGPTAEVTAVCDSATTKPRVLFVGNSYMWAIKSHVPLNEIFDNVEFWYYFSTAYSGDDLSVTHPVVGQNLLERLLDFDYIVWFTTGNQMNKGTDGFAQAALFNLAVDDSLRRTYLTHIADTLTMEGPDTLRRQKAYSILIRHPELISELSGDSLSVRNSEIHYAHYTKDIRKDTAWMAALEAQAFLRTASTKMMLYAEVDRIKAGRPLYKDQTDEIQFSLRCQQEAKALAKKIPDNEAWMHNIVEYAEKHDTTIEKTLEDAAIWTIKRKYHLDHCRLTDDPDAIISLPPDFQP